jgi:triacylglycerol lipase
VLVHGLWDGPAVFRRLERALAGRRDPLLIPDLPLRLGLLPIEAAAELLGRHIEEAFGTAQAVDLLGFSIGGVIARTWIQLQQGHRRTRRFLSVGSPQQGTLTALPWPRSPLAGIADLKDGSALRRRLDADLEPLRRVDCHSFYCEPDLMVVPSRRALLPLGQARRLPVHAHPQLLRHPLALDPLVEELLRL